MKTLKNIILAMASLMTLYASADEAVLLPGSYGTIFENGEWVSDQFYDGGWLNDVLPNENSDLTVTSFWGRVLGNGTVKLNSLKIQGGFEFLNLTSAQEQNHPGSSYQNMAPTFEIAQNIVIDTNETVHIGQGAGQGYGAEKISVDGDIVFTVNALGGGDHGILNRFFTSFNPFAATPYSESNLSMDVGGVIKFEGRPEGDLVSQIMNGSKWVMNACKTSNDLNEGVDAFIRVNGIDGFGSLQNYGGGAKSTTLIFQAQEGKTFQGGTFIGYVEKQGPELRGVSSDLHIIMDGGVDGGRQTMRMDSVDYFWNDGIDALTLTVRSGEFYVSNKLRPDNLNGDTKFTSIDLLAGKLGIARTFDDDNNAGQLLTEVLNWNANSTIHMEIVNGKSSILMAADINLIGEGAFEIIIDDYDIIDTSKDYAFIRFAADGLSSEDLAKISIKTKDGMYHISSLAFGEDNTVIGSFTAIPEPSTMAAVFGALALALAYRRRR